eukprot:SAG11_NODE_784_length_7187_cov_2.920429_7_plen_82_part_00
MILLSVKEANLDLVFSSGPTICFANSSLDHTMAYDSTSSTNGDEVSGSPVSSSLDGAVQDFTRQRARQEKPERPMRRHLLD